jgi:hypothetical protein
VKITKAQSGSEPANPANDQGKAHYADIRIMPTSARSVLVSAVVRANLVGIIQAS